MKRFSLMIFALILLNSLGVSWGQSPLCPKGKTVLVPYVDGIVIPVVPKTNHCVADLTDSDNDGMADSWELAWFGDLNAANGLGYMTDVDEDGISDLEEYERGGNPTKNDALAILTANRCQQQYLPFGDAVNSDDCGQIQHTGRVHDKGTDLHYNRARYYDAAVGQFLSPDPVSAVNPHTGEANLAVLLEPQRLNSYAYALNNPYRYEDPNGEFVITVPIVAATLFTAATGALVAHQTGAFEATQNLIDGVSSDLKNAFNHRAEAESENEDDDPEFETRRPRKGDKLRKKPGKLGQFKGSDALKAENRVPNDAAKKAGLTKSEQRKLHKEIQGRELDFHDILEIANDIKKGKL